ncbi:hypothetical protein [Colidextribacter sp. OB.20]|nr:hypothetical protein [Colidextribacter sp. OB.20]
MSKKKILKAILLALSVLLTAVQNSDGKGEPEKFDPDTHLE